MPQSIDNFEDGGVYSLPEGLSLVQTNLFLRVGRMDDVFVKVASERALSDHAFFVKDAKTDAYELRPLVELERFGTLDQNLQMFPAFQKAAAINRDYAHYLLIHRLQFDRLRLQTAVQIPPAHFALVANGSGHLPALFQQRVRGVTLWSMFDFTEGKVRDRWQASLPAISRQLAPLIGSDLEKHIDWNIKNFIFDQTDERLYYVDQKPSVFIGRESNDHNLKGICSHFLV